MSEMQEDTPGTAIEQVPITPGIKPGTIARMAEEQEEQDLLTWLNGFGPLGEVQISVKRKEPKEVVTKSGKLTLAGWLDTFDEIIDESRLRDEYGGGVYELTIKKRNKEGKFVYFKHRTVKISGKPKFDDPGAVVATGSPTEPVNLSQQALTTVTKILDEERNRKPEAAVPAADIIEAAQRPLLDTIRELRDDAKEDRKLTRAALDKASVPPAPPPRDDTVAKLLDKAIDGESVRMTALRTQFDSERNQLTTYWQNQVERALDSAQRQIDAAEKAHEREMRTVEKAHESAMATAKTAHDGVVKALERDVARLERELSAKDAELAQLRAQKQLSPIEQIHQMRELKEALTDEKDEEGGESTAERIIGTILTSNPVAAIATRIAGQAAPAQQQPQAQDPNAQFAALAASMEPGKPFQFMGQYFVKTQSGQIARVKPRKGSKAATAVAKVPVDPNAPAQEEQPDISEEDMANAVVALESAINSRTTPAEFALTAKIMAPKAVAIVRKFGVEKLIALAKLSDDSPIITQRGKTFLREMAEALTS